MTRKAVCPACGKAVPRWWWIKRKFRPCVSCAARIRAVPKNDRWWSIGIGAVGPPLSAAIVGSADLLIALHHGTASIPDVFIAFALGWIVGIPLSVAFAFWAFPYFAPFELECASGRGFPVQPSHSPFDPEPDGRSGHSMQ